MPQTDLEVLLAEAVRPRRLLDHPFYQRWQAGTLVKSELAAYAGQYRHFEAVLPTALTKIRDRVSVPAARALVQANLDEELGVPTPHLELFDAFADAVGAPPSVAATPATCRLVDLYLTEAMGDPVSALAAVAAYEVQSADVAATKADGLRARYGVADEGTRFWDVHASMDRAHGRWVTEALGALGADSDRVSAGARAGACAWWAFLDEREAAAAV
jgi:pyrroloquinoline quinone (PQQ) biosynthesis protein C